MSGNISKNDSKSNPKHPDWKGEIVLNDKVFNIALWEKEDNPTLMSLSITDPEDFKNSNFSKDIKNNMRGYLAVNEKKATEKQPDYRGKFTVEKEYFISGWIRDEAISVSITDPAEFLKSKGGDNAIDNSNVKYQYERGSIDENGDPFGDIFSS